MLGSTETLTDVSEPAWLELDDCDPEDSPPPLDWVDELDEPDPPPHEASEKPRAIRTGNTTFLELFMFLPP